MLNLLQQILINQFEAALCALDHSVARCPKELWNAPVARYPLCQVAFHALFFTDYYLEKTPATLREQNFHQANSAFFADYEQLEDREPVALYPLEQIRSYATYCRQKAVATITAETEADLAAQCGFPPKLFSRAELHVYNIRHVQHHAAQLILRLRIDSAVDIPWMRSGWRELVS
jgi:hypothetical protein